MRTAPGSGGTRVAVVMAAYSRKKLTLACLRSLRAQQVPGVALDVFVLDEASSDGTSGAIAEQFPDVTVLQGDGELYWNGGMRRAFAAAIAGDYDYYLWMNDDTSLDDGGLAVLLDTAGQLRERGEEAVIVAGSTKHPDTGELTYGGVVHPHCWRPLRSELVEPGDAPRPCDTTNGNATLISRAVVQRIGNIDPAFVQQMGDFDYGLRPGGRLFGLGRPRDGRDLRVPSGATHGRAALGGGAAASLVAEAAQARTVGGLLPAVGREALAAVLAEPVCAGRPSSGPPARTACASRGSVSGPVVR